MSVAAFVSKLMYGDQRKEKAEKVLGDADGHGQSEAAWRRKIIGRGRMASWGRETMNTDAGAVVVVVKRAIRF